MGSRAGVDGYLARSLYVLSLASRVRGFSFQVKQHPLQQLSLEFFLSYKACWRCVQKDLGTGNFLSRDKSHALKVTKS